MRYINHFLLAGVRHKFGRRHEHEPGAHLHGGGRFGGRWGARTRRGEGKFLVLEALSAAPQHGYEIMSAIEQKRGFRPSPGSIYPTLQMLDDGGFVTSVELDGKRVYTISESGRELLAGHSAGRPAGPDADDDDDARGRARQSAMKLMAAMMSARASDDATLDKICVIIDRARREIHSILATDET